VVKEEGVALEGSLAPMTHPRNFLALALSAMLAQAAVAQAADTAPNPDPPPLTDQQLAYGGAAIPPTPGPIVPPPEEKAQAAAEHRQWPHALPFLAQRVIDKGIDLPEPYDVGASLYLSREQRILSSLKVGINGAPLELLDFVGFPRTEIKNQSLQVLPGAWILPFLKVYGILGSTQGGGDIDITMEGSGLMKFLGIPGCNLPPGVQPELCTQTLRGTAHANYTGTSYGIGTTVAGAFRSLFFAMPVSYVIAEVTQSDTPAKTWNIAPRVGYLQRLGGPSSVTWYAGGTYLKSDFNITGQFTFDTTDTIIGKPTTMAYSIHVEPKDNWNWLAGVNWTIDRTWSVLAEAGFGGTRSNLLLTAFYRF
jgi:hypothetical protein